MSIEHFFIEEGNGFPLILLHGNGEDHSYFEQQIAFFSSFYRVIALDTRGHGKTPRGEREFTISQFADDLYEFMLKQNISKAHILGFSDGANIAMKFAIKYPEYADKLILNGGNLYPEGVKRSVQIPIELGYKIASFFVGVSNKAKMNTEMLGLMVNDPNISLSELQRIKHKTLVIAGTKDMIKEEHTRLIADTLSDSSLVFINGDHFIASKNSTEFNKAVFDFLRQ